MSQIVVDAFLRTRLLGLTEELTLCAEQGKILGHFVPISNGNNDCEDRIVVLPQDQCPYTLEELAAMRKETGGRPLREIWKSLGVK